VVLQLRPGEAIHVREHQFLLATDGMPTISSAFAGSPICCSAAPAFLSTTSSTKAAQAFCLLHGYGNVFTKTLAPGEAIDVEPGAFLWKDASVTMDTNVTNLSTGLFGGTSFTLNRFFGPGRVGIQSMTYHPPMVANEGQQQTGINLGGLFNT